MMKAIGKVVNPRAPSQDSLNVHGVGASVHVAVLPLSCVAMTKGENSDRFTFPASVSK